MTAAEVRRTLGYLDLARVHPALGIRAAIELRERRWTGPMATYAATLVAMADSDRMPNEFETALAVLNPLREAHLVASGERAEHLEARVAEILRCAQALRDARSGMACDLYLDLIRTALDEARAELGVVN